MGRTLYCARCLTSFAADEERCPNLACATPRPDLGWGRLLEAGDLLDRHYRVLRRLAVGGAGITYLARETEADGSQIGPELAIKVLYQKQDGTFLNRLANEARVLQDLDHPHIVTGRGFVHRAGHPAYLITVYASGGNLYDHVRHTGALDPPVACALAVQVLSALHTTHRRGIVHRDLKPQNVFLREPTPRTTAPHALVGDFGIAKLTGFLGDGLTTAGTFLGTPEFAAPEQFKGLAPEPASDVYAAMCVLWFCLTGAPPVRFADRSDLVGCLRTLRETLPPRLPADAVPEPARSALDEVFAHTLTAEPSDRWPIDRLIEVLRALPSAPARSPAPSPPAADPPQDAITLPPGLELDPAPAPPPEPPGRLRLREPEREPAPPPESGMDALFGGSAPPEPEVEPAPAGLSLDDLLGPVPASPPAPRQDPPASSPSRDPDPPAAPEPEPADLGPWTPVDPAPPGAPATDRDRLEALARCAPADRGPVLAALVDPSGAVGALGPSSPVAALIGACLAVAELALERHAAWARALLPHPDPDVRATAALAVGATGKLGQLALLARGLTDPDARVRLASVHALKGLSARTGRPELAQDWLGPLASDPDARVRRAARP